MDHIRVESDLSAGSGHILEDKIGNFFDHGVIREILGLVGDRFLVDLVEGEHLRDILDLVD